MRHFRWQIGFNAALVAFLAWNSSVRADEKHPPKYKYHDTHHKAHEVDLTKADQRQKLFSELEAGEVAELEIDKPIAPLAIAWDTALWTIVVFVLLLVILRKAAWGPMLEGLQKREETIKSAVEEAKLAREETRRITAQFQAEMAAKMAEIPKIMEEARRDAEQLKEEMRAQATKDNQADRQRLRRELDIAFDQARQELFTHTARLATLISAKAIGRHLTEDDHRRLIDEALGEMTKTGQN